jgi:hypothetical protein
MITFSCAVKSSIKKEIENEWMNSLRLRAVRHRLDATRRRFDGNAGIGRISRPRMSNALCRSPTGRFARGCCRLEIE